MNTNNHIQLLLELSRDYRENHARNIIETKSNILKIIDLLSDLKIRFTMGVSYLQNT